MASDCQPLNQTPRLSEIRNYEAEEIARIVPNSMEVREAYGVRRIPALFGMDRSIDGTLKAPECGALHTLTRPGRPWESLVAAAHHAASR